MFNITLVLVPIIVGAALYGWIAGVWLGLVFSIVVLFTDASLFLAISVLLSGAPFMFLILCLIIILDGGLGLFKVTFIRVFKVNPMKNIRTPLHDHFRKKGGWSNTQVVNRFMILQALISLIALGMVK